MLSTIARQIDRDGERYLLLVFYTMIVLVIGVEVTRRFALQAASLWGEEIARYSLIYLIWIGASYAVRTRTHIRIDIVQGFIPTRHHIWIYMLGDVATLLFVLIAFYYSIWPIVSAIQFGTVTEGLRVSKAYALLALPLGFSMTTIRVVQNLVRDFSDYAAGREVYSGKKLFE